MFQDSPSHRSGIGGKRNVDYRTTWTTFRMKTLGVVAPAIALLALVPSGPLPMNPNSYPILRRPRYRLALERAMPRPGSALGLEDGLVLRYPTDSI